MKPEKMKILQKCNNVVVLIQNVNGEQLRGKYVEIMTMRLVYRFIVVTSYFDCRTKEC